MVFFFKQKTAYEMRISDWSSDVCSSDLMQNKAVRDAYEEMAPEYEIARAIIEARIASGLTQAELAERMKTSQSYIAKLESGRAMPSLRTLVRVGQATGRRPRFSFERRPESWALIREPVIMP